MKRLLHEVDRALAEGQLTRNQLCMLLAALLAREAIVRAKLSDESGASGSSSSSREESAGEP